MAEQVGSRSPGSIVLQILIVLLAIFLLLAILHPNKQWEQQEKNKQISHLRMENLYFASDFYHKKTGGYTRDINELLTFAEQESLKVYPAGFKLDRLTREESGIDSFLVDYFDPYPHFSHFEEVPSYDYPGGKKDSIVLTLNPLPVYTFLPASQYAFKAEQQINTGIDDRGRQGKYLLIGSQGKMQRENILPEPVMVQGAKYIYNQKPDSIGICPTTGMPYKTWVNVEIDLKAQLSCELHDDAIDTALAKNELLSSILVFRWLKETDALAKAELARNKTFDFVEDSLINEKNVAFLAEIENKLRIEGKDNVADAVYDTLLEDTALEDSIAIQLWESILDSSYNYMNSLREDPEFIEVRDNIVNFRKDQIAAEKLQEKINTVQEDESLTISEIGTVISVADSINHYADKNLIKSKLFKAHFDSVTTRFRNQENIAELLNRLSYTEDYGIQKVDSVGVTIESPIEGRWNKKNKSILEVIFRVKGEQNHGKIENGDLSWDAKR